MSSDLSELTLHRQAMLEAYRMDESNAVSELLKIIAFSNERMHEVHDLAHQLVASVRTKDTKESNIQTFMMQYDLSTEEGILLMCLAEALLRIPDKPTEKRLIRDKLSGGSWSEHAGKSESGVVNMASRGLAICSKLLAREKSNSGFKRFWNKLVYNSGEPMIRRAVREAMKMMSEHFVLGRSIEHALKRSLPYEKQGYRFSYDMLGEVARTQADADRYFESYRHAIQMIGESHENKDLKSAPSISIKLSALHPRFEYTKRAVIVKPLTKRVKELVLYAKSLNVPITLDAEEADRLELLLDIFQALISDPDFACWNGLGLAVQAYQKRAVYVIDWLIALAKHYQCCIPVRLVKGAYWDTEIKLSQMNGFENYPVFTRKNNTDISYAACVKKMLGAQEQIFPQFATHNAYSVALVLTIMGSEINSYSFEFQNLQGMGKALHQHLIDEVQVPSRIYAPVGLHEDLLPYLVRRLLENGANSSFVNQIADRKIPIVDLIQSPMMQLDVDSIPNPNIPLPLEIFGQERKNSKGFDLSNEKVVTQLQTAIDHALEKKYSVVPFQRELTRPTDVLDPSDHRRTLGRVELGDKDDAELALKNALDSYHSWNGKSVARRAEILRNAASLFEVHYVELIALAVREAGKTIPNAISELREAVDFCRYYANQAEKYFKTQTLSGYTGETNELSMHGRGVFLCISPWNFPIAIFAGQVAAALVCGNTVIAKPANQTSLVAARVTHLFHRAGVPKNVLQLFPSSAVVVGERLVASPDIAGIVFTGSNATAHIIQKTLVERKGPIIPFIAETSGINAMIADSTALSEQLVFDVIQSAFDSAGQRCSALRILCVQDDIADNVLKMLAGAMAEISVGDPLNLETDVGPIIDKVSLRKLQEYEMKIQREGKLIYKVMLPAECKHGTFLAPQAYEIPSVKLVKTEVFGPILHVVRYQREKLDQLIDDINSLGYGLTFGIQSRIDETIDYIQKRIKVGNVYVNRNIIGAVVGVQPFGGSRLSGTGPKAGGPIYLSRFCDEKTLTINTTAAGGNASLMSMADGD